MSNKHGLTFDELMADLKNTKPLGQQNDLLQEVSDDLFRDFVNRHRDLLDKPQKKINADISVEVDLGHKALKVVVIECNGSKTEIVLDADSALKMGKDLINMANLVKALKEDK
jgi:hypothetical protein